MRLCSSFRSSILLSQIVTDRAILQSATVVLLQIGTIFSFHLLHFQSARGFHFLSLMIHWNLLSFWCERWSFFPSSSLDSFILEFDWSPNHSLFCEDGFELNIWLSKTFKKWYLQNFVSISGNKFHYVLEGCNKTSRSQPVLKVECHLQTLTPSQGYLHPRPDKTWLFQWCQRYFRKRVPFALEPRPYKTEAWFFIPVFNTCQRYFRKKAWFCSCIFSNWSSSIPRILMTKTRQVLGPDRSGTSQDIVGNTNTFKIKNKKQKYSISILYLS